MNIAVLSKVFGEGVKAALRLFQNPVSRRALAKSAEQLVEAVAKVAK